MKLSLQLAKSSSEESLEKDGWSNYDMEPKYDGMRVAIRKIGNDVVVYGRSWDEYTEHVPHLVEKIREIDVDIHLDGEIVFVRDMFEFEGQDVPIVDFNQTMRIMGSNAPKAVTKQSEVGLVKFVIFDIMQIGSIDLTSKSDEERRKSLEALVSDPSALGPDFILTPRWSQWNPDYVDTLIKAGAEGVMMKNRNAIYSGKRPNKTWYKIKREDTFDVIVMGTYEGTGKHSGRLGGLKFGACASVSSGKLEYVGRVGGGFSDEEREQLWGSRNELVGKVIEIKCNDVVGSGMYKTPRHPQFVCFRIDKLAGLCIMEQFKL